MRDDIRELQDKLKETDFACVPEGVWETRTEIYPAVEYAYPPFCDDTYRCTEVCSQGNDEPEWKHAVRRVQQQLVRQEESRINRHPDHGKWEFGPLFEMGKEYDRRKLHDTFGGTRYRGIAPSGDHPLVFLVTGESGKAHGYQDEFHGDTFIYTGEGREGDMEWSMGNRIVRDHKEESHQLHLFENTDEAWIITYVGQFEYIDHFRERLPDTSGNLREAIRFKLAPIHQETAIEDGVPPKEREPEELFEQAKLVGQTNTGEMEIDKTTTTSTRRNVYQRAQIVRQFALRHADGVCQGCKEDAPFLDQNGTPYLEVHHLHRRSDGGPDSPENVIALCPNCHRRVHQGKDGDEFNRELIIKAEERNSTIRT